MGKLRKGKYASRKKPSQFVLFFSLGLILLALLLIVLNISEVKDTRQQAQQSTTPTKVPLTPTRIPTLIPQATPVKVQGNTNLLLTVFLHGIGNGGDNTNSNGFGNVAPIHPQRNLYLEIYNNRNQLVMKQEGLITFEANAGNFKGFFDLGSDFQTGSYTLKVKTDTYLRRQIGGFITLSNGKEHVLPQLSLIAGDTNNDNKLDILDFNMIMRCYNYPLSIKTCNSAMKNVADIDDDSRVDGSDYNLFLREIWAQAGQ